MSQMLQNNTKVDFLKISWNIATHCGATFFCFAARQRNVERRAVDLCRALRTSMRCRRSWSTLPLYTQRTLPTRPQHLGDHYLHKPRTLMSTRMWMLPRALMAMRNQCVPKVPMCLMRMRIQIMGHPRPVPSFLSLTNPPFLKHPISAMKAMEPIGHTKRVPSTPSGTSPAPNFQEIALQSTCMRMLNEEKQCRLKSSEIFEMSLAKLWRVLFLYSGKVASTSVFFIVFLVLNLSSSLMHFVHNVIVFVNLCTCSLYRPTFCTELEQSCPAHCICKLYLVILLHTGRHCFCQCFAYFEFNFAAFLQNTDCWML